MKKLVGLVTILAVLILGGYYGMGVLTEKTITKNVGAMNQSNGLNGELTQYQRGLFTSQANITWHLHIPQRSIMGLNGAAQNLPAQDFEVAMPITIYHGPIIVANKHIRFGMGEAQTVVPVPKQYETLFDNLLKKESKRPELVLSIFVSYLNKSTLDVSIPSFNLLAREGNGQLDWKGLEANVSISNGSNQVDGGLRLKGVSGTKDDAKVVLGAVTSDYNLHRTSAGFFLGDAKFSIPDLLVSVKDQKMFELSQFDLGTESDVKDNLLASHLSVTLGSIYAQGQNYGPGAMEVTLKNLDAEVLGKMNEQANAMQNATQIEKQQAMLAMLPQLPKLFSKGAQFEISKLSMKLPQGMIEGNLFVALPKGDSGNPFELVQKIQGHAKLQMPIAVVKAVMQNSLLQQFAAQPQVQQNTVAQLQAAQQQNPQPQDNQKSFATMTAEEIAVLQTARQIAILEKSGLVTIEADNYLSDINLQQGKFMVNGKPFNPAMLSF